MPKQLWKRAPSGFTLIEILVALAITSILVVAIYRFFIGQHHAYTVQDQVIEMEQNARAAMDMIRRDLRMAGYHAMGDDLINNLSDFVPSSFIPTSPVTVNLDANPKISEGSGTDPDVITFLSVLPTSNNPTTIFTAVSPGNNLITLNLTSTQTDDQYNVGDMIHIGTSSEYATITAISGSTLTIDTNPADAGSSQGIAQNYAVGTPIGEIYVVSYAVFNDDNDPSFDRHDPGHPVLKRNANGGGFQPVAENITDMQLSHLGSGEIEVILSSRTDRADHKFQSNGGYRTYTANARIKSRNTANVAVGTDCAVPAAVTNLELTGLNDTYPCKIHITWNPVTGTTDCEVFKYIVYYGTTSGTYAYSVDVGNVTAYTLDVTALKACTYNVAVAAVNDAGTGSKSAESITDNQAPATPIGLKAVNINGVEREVVLSWDKNTECDLYGYNVFVRSDSVNSLKINTVDIISNNLVNYIDANFPSPYTVGGCDTYYYRMEAVDYCCAQEDEFCANASALTDEVAVSPTKPEPPTGPGFSTTTTTDTLSWILSADDFEEATTGLNYIVGYKVYGYDEANNLVTLKGSTTEDLLSKGTNEWSTNAGVYTTYGVSAVDACEMESDPLIISSSCTVKPSISITQPVNDATVYGTIPISGTVTPPEGRDIRRVALQIDSGVLIDLALSDALAWSYDWNSNHVENGPHTITVNAYDTEGCYDKNDISITVDNDVPVVHTLFCDVFVCKNTGNSPIFLVVYVYDDNNEPVSDATVESNILFGSQGDGSKIIPETSIGGYYGGDEIPGCNLYAVDVEKSIPAENLAIASTHQRYENKSETAISISVSKDGFSGSNCTIIAK